MNSKNRISLNGNYYELYGHFDFQNTYNKICDSLGEKDLFIEVGSAWGKSAIYMMEKLYEKDKKIDFYCIDIFTQDQEIDDIEFPFSNGKTYREKFKNQTLYYDFIYNINNSYAKEYKPTPIRTYSDMGAELFENNSIKAVFIDAAHDFDSVKKDLEAWWPKLKKDGILAGHDFYSMENGYSEDNGVAKALKQFISEKEIKINELEGSTFLINKSLQNKI